MMTVGLLINASKVRVFEEQVDGERRKKSLEWRTRREVRKNGEDERDKAREREKKRKLRATIKTLNEHN